MEIHGVDKLQGESYTGITIRPDGSNTGASLDMRPFYESYQAGVPIETILKQISSRIEEVIAQIPIVDARSLADYEHMKTRLIMQAVPTEPNRELLEMIPHKDMDGISIVYRFQLDHFANADATILVTNQMLETYGITAEQLMADAALSAPVKNPVSIRPLSEMMAEMSGVMYEPEKISAPPLLVATVPGYANGAGILGYPDFFESAAKMIGGDFYIIPSSIHEVLLLADDGFKGAEELNAMISSVNASVVSPKDWLADEAYHYDSKAKVFEKAAAYEGRTLAERAMPPETIPGIVSEPAAAFEPESETITVLMVEPGKYPRQVELGTELEDLQKAVGGNIEVVYPFDDKIGLIMNEEGKIHGLPLNRALRDEQGEMYDVVAGTFLVVGLTDDNFGSLTPDQIQKYEEIFHYPEMFMKMGRGLMALPVPDEITKNGDKPAHADKTTKTADAKSKQKKTPDHDSR